VTYNIGHQLNSKPKYPFSPKWKCPLLCCRFLRVYSSYR
jgi:hypothetical protein